MDNKDYLKKILSANIHISDKNKLDESLDAMLDGGSGVTSWNDLQDKPFGEGEAITILPEYTFTLNDVSDGVKFGVASFSEVGASGRGFNIGDTVIIHAVSQTYEVVVTASQEDCLFGPGLPEAKVTLHSALKFSLICDTKKTILEGEGGFLLVSDGFPANKFIIAAEVRGVKTIDPRYLPQTGGNMIIHITQTEDGSNYIADWTYEEIAEAIQKGIIPVCVFGGRLFYLTLAPVLEEIMPMEGLFYFNFSTLIMNFNYSTYRHESISIYSNNSVNHDMANIAIPK